MADASSDGGVDQRISWPLVVATCHAKGTADRPTKRVLKLYALIEIDSGDAGTLGQPRLRWAAGSARRYRPDRSRSLVSVVPTRPVAARYGNARCACLGFFLDMSKLPLYLGRSVQHNGTIVQDVKWVLMSGKPQFDEVAVIAAGNRGFLAQRLCGRCCSAI